MYPLPNSLEHRLTNRNSGSQVIALSVCDWFEQLEEAPDPTAFVSLARGILERRPYFALLADLLHGVGQSCYAAATRPTLSGFKSAAAHWREPWLAACDRLVSDRGPAPAQLRVATFSNSGAVACYLGSLAARETSITALCARSEPGGEGEFMGRRLASRSIRSQVVSDDELVRQMKTVDLLLLGADAVFAEAFINKVGTCGQAARARDLGLPVIMVAETQKWVPPGWRLEASWRAAAAAHEGQAPVPPSWFELVDLQLVSMVQSEFGQVSTDLVARTAGAKGTFQPLLS